jgi:CBS domain-containing protein
MSHVRDLLQAKGHHVWTTSPRASVLEAASLMNQHKIGALVVLDKDRLAGIFTERDILQRVVAEQRPPADTPVGKVMTTEVACCSPSTSIEEARGAMKNRRIRHLPVLDQDGNLNGLISIGDLNAHAQAESELTIFLMDEYIHGRT